MSRKLWSGILFYPGASRCISCASSSRTDASLLKQTRGVEDTVKSRVSSMQKPACHWAANRYPEDGIHRQSHATSKGHADAEFCSICEPFDKRSHDPCPSRSSYYTYSPSTGAEMPLRRLHSLTPASISPHVVPSLTSHIVTPRPSVSLFRLSSSKKSISSKGTPVSLCNFCICVILLPG